MNNNFLDTYLLKGQNTVVDGTMLEIERGDDELLVHVELRAAVGHKATFAYDRVICCAGFRFDRSIFHDDCKPELRSCGRLPLMSASWESTNVPDLYFAGTIMQCRDYKKTMSSFIHGFRHNIEVLGHILCERYADVPYPRASLDTDVDTVTDHMIERMSVSAALFLQPSFLCDAIVVPRNGPSECFEGVPVDWVRERGLTAGDHSYLLTLEFGEYDGDPFFVERQPTVNATEGDAFLHPVIRHYRGNELVDTLHISDHLENDWRPNGHPGVRPVVQAFEFVGLDDARDVQKTYRQKLHAFVARHLGAHLTDRSAAMPAQ